MVQYRQIKVYNRKSSSYRMFFLSKNKTTYVHVFEKCIYFNIA